MQLRTLAEFYVEEVQRIIAIWQELSLEHRLPGGLGDGVKALIEVLNRKVDVLREMAWEKSSADYMSMPEDHHRFRCPQEVSGRKGAPHIVQADQVQRLPCNAKTLY